jgi:hypothetical protein
LPSAGTKPIKFLADIQHTAEKRREPRVALIKRVEASWEDEAHAERTAPAKLLDRVPGGVCILISIPIEVGSKLTLKSQHEQFSGTVVNSRRDKRDYILGIKWDVPADSG